MKIKTIGYLILFSLISFQSRAFAACDSCFVPRTARTSDYSLGADTGGFFLDFRYEYQNWDSRSESHDIGTDSEGMHSDQGEDSHADHEDEHRTSLSRHSEPGGHGHNRSQDRLYHFSAGYNFGEDLTVLAHLPFIERFELQDSGSERSDGFGDLTLLSTWRPIKWETGFAGPVLGVKLPSGDTSERNSHSERFEPELQPGTGSTDVIMGAAFEEQFAPWILRGNALYFLRTEGSQNYEFGDTTSISLFLDYTAYSAGNTSVFAGVDINFQHAEKDLQNGSVVGASGADLLFLGPNLTFSFAKNSIFSVAVLFPVVQDRGGDHQDLESVWFAGGRVFF
ncbi:MAG: hypothetical protein J5J00_02595 [Deltaproteobacteria bacterium]|nr:hypothetical protein [Deltaproteobacteria bacterium]